MNGVKKKKFALIGAAGFVAPRHMKAIAHTGNELVAVLDPHDSLGVIDSYFPDARCFTEFERFDRHLEKLRRHGDGVDFVSICSPNYLHDAHIRLALRLKADAICEKPLVLNPWNIDALSAIEAESGRRVWNILQLRLHPETIALKNRIAEMLKHNPKKMFDVKLVYITERGKWYFVSWKGDDSKSGGLIMNIGVHFLDMLVWLFGGVVKTVMFSHGSKTVSGVMRLEHAYVKWFLSVGGQFLDAEALETGSRVTRSIVVDGEPVEFSSGFDDLHTISYQEILAGRGFGLQDARVGIELIHKIKDSAISLEQ